MRGLCCPWGRLGQQRRRVNFPWRWRCPPRHLHQRRQQQRQWLLQPHGHGHGAAMTWRVAGWADSRRSRHVDRQGSGGGLI